MEHVLSTYFMKTIYRQNASKKSYKTMEPLNVHQQWKHHEQSVFIGNGNTTNSQCSSAPAKPLTVCWVKSWLWQCRWKRHVMNWVDRIFACVCGSCKNHGKRHKSKLIARPICDQMFHIAPTDNKIIRKSDDRLLEDFSSKFDHESGSMISAST